jgi:nucleoid-associated protein YgaU
MTSDAKVGLLLGLVFIFVIAFIINGLPSFYQSTNSSELTTNMVNSQSQQIGIASNERKVYREVIDRTQLPRPVVAQAEAADDPVVRFETELPGAALVQQTLMPQQSPALSPPAPVVLQTETPKQPSAGFWPKTHIVGRGDTLGFIAKKYYGSEEGNKQASVEKIFAANKNSLDSIDQIVERQKLIIPALTAGAGPVEPSIADSLLEKVKSIGRRHLSAKGETPNDNSKAKSKGQYVVCEGDNLWRIAASRLGDGNRYPEIARLNSGTLKDENSLVVGMRLNLPVR